VFLLFTRTILLLAYVMRTWCHFLFYWSWVY